MSQPIITEREREVLNHLVRGRSNKLIARELGISPFTVRDHVTCMLKKTGLNNRLELGLFVVRSDLILIPPASDGLIKG